MSFDPVRRAVEHAQALEAKGYAREDLLPMLDVVGASLKARAHLNLVDDCHDCPRMGICKVKAKGFGNNNPPVMIVGEKASEDDMMYGQAMTGQEGMLLTLILNKMGVDRNFIYITNLVKCYSEGNRPGVEEAERCISFLASEILLMKPAVIVTLGQLASATVLRDQSLRMPGARGTWGDFGGVPVLATYDPKYLLALSGEREVKAKTELWLDLNAAFERAHDERPGAQFHPDLAIKYSWVAMRERQQKAG